MVQFVVSVQGATAQGNAWRHIGSRAESALRRSLYTETALTAENGGAQALLLRLPGDGHPAQALQHPFDPLLLAGALTVETRQLRLIVDVDAVSEQPYNVARQLASLDHISEGRAGWLLRADADPVAARRLAEFVSVVRSLWSSWPTESIIIDPVAGVLTDRSRVVPPAHHGEFFDVAGILNVPQPPSGSPPLTVDLGDLDESHTALPLLGLADSIVLPAHAHRARAVLSGVRSAGVTVPALLPVAVDLLDETRANRVADQLISIPQETSPQPPTAPAGLPIRGSLRAVVDTLAGWLADGVDGFVLTPGLTPSSILDVLTAVHPLLAGAPIPTEVIR
ncbi:MAG: LLM class flavin-dependent oxidoreductase [Gordonia sp. (in: high G+C Gram-positive bacteria)]